jgi:hypothetical protein
MKFEEAIAEMRKGKRCRSSIYPNMEYYIQCNTLKFDQGHYLGIPSIQTGGMGDVWSVIEPPPPLPRLFRARFKGNLVSGAEFSQGDYRFCIDRPYRNDSQTHKWASLAEITDLEYIDANSR